MYWHNFFVFNIKTLNKRLTITINKNLLFRRRTFVVASESHLQPSPTCDQSEIELFTLDAFTVHSRHWTELLPLLRPQVAAGLRPELVTGHRLRFRIVRHGPQEVQILAGQPVRLFVLRHLAPHTSRTTSWTASRNILQKQLRYTRVSMSNRLTNTHTSVTRRYFLFISLSGYLTCE